ncbi:type I phosphomannose isomerase catalytic subunit [Pseudothermotoga sp.]|nr:class I mannose-6-phosphate isomerase [Pseudothermotoga sp.]MCX7812047.1 class I mannose-6-phosphate isomerase [Pseudothermotoga sp.]MDW8139117.1 class I mannose-6-phosphate isomerase [Pseudothermotoga sp.]
MVLKVKPRFRPIVWGNPKLNRSFNIEADPPIGEVWLLSEVEPLITSIDGVQNLKLKDLLDKFDLRFPRFPVLIKIVSPAQWLSIQVHPDDELARILENEPWGKTECWYFVEPGEVALIPRGTELKYLSDLDQVRSKLVFLNMKPGELLFIPAGLVHTLGPNSLVIEIQQASDLTYRIYDWNRGRELHLEKAMKALKDFDLEKLIHKNFERLHCELFSVYRVIGRTHLPGFSIVIFLNEGVIAKYRAKPFETFISMNETLEGDAIVVKIRKK